MAKQFLVPGESYLNDAEDGKEVLVPGEGVWNSEAAAGGLMGPRIFRRRRRFYRSQAA